MNYVVRKYGATLASFPPPRRDCPQRGILFRAMDRIFFALGSLLALVAVGLGAFGAHSLQGSFATGMADVYETGVRYQFYHALGLLAVAFAVTRWQSSLVPIAGWLFVAG